MTEYGDTARSEERQLRALLIEGLRELENSARQEVRFYQMASDKIDSGEWGPREFIEAAEERDLDMAENLPDIE